MCGGMATAITTCAPPPGQCDLRIAYPGGVTALHFAASHGHAAIAEALLSGKGCKLAPVESPGDGEEQPEPGQHSPQHAGGFRPDEETQRLLLDKTGDTVLHAVGTGWLGLLWCCLVGSVWWSGCVCACERGNACEFDVIVVWLRG